MTGYKMDRYHRGSGTIAAFKIWIGAQLKVENPIPLRTISNLDLLPSCPSVMLLYDNNYLSGSFD
jgi:hypothetical protein